MSKKENASGYGFHPSTPKHKIAGYKEGREGLLLWHEEEMQGLAPFGPQAGIITEDKLTPGIVDFLMSKTDGYGNKLYEMYLVKDGKAPEVLDTEGTATKATRQRKTKVEDFM